ncbi:MAG: ABC transporter ATP-binding protein, partial [Candidatus Brocadiae bacterium]|nr:ABC transporter ATP-binding protein [Candidatus Brocadiia bacterium]
DAFRRRVKGFSKGMRQRLGIAIAIAKNAEVILLDEPTSGLDVASARLIRDIVRQLNREGLTVFLTTHNMAEAEQMCSRVDIINEGKIVAVDTTDELRNLIKSRQLLEVAFADEHEPVGQALAGLDGVTDCIPDGGAYMLQTQEPGEVAVRVCRLAETKGWAIEAIRTRKPTLEEAFLHLTGGKGGAQRGDSQRMRGQGGGHGDRH